jgi:hypothetical protein
MGARTALRSNMQLVADAQDILTRYLVPDGLTSHEALNELLGLLDGPRSREAKALAEQALMPQLALNGDVVSEDVDFAFVWTKHGRLPRVAHGTDEDALREAERLARKNPGRKFIVLHAHTKLHLPSPAKETA